MAVVPALACRDRMAHPWPTTPPTAADRASYADAEPRPFWLADLPVHAEPPALVGAHEADLAIVGGGFTGLWAAVQAKEEDPGREIVVLEAASAGSGASGRNGGFAAASLTHGLANGVARFGAEIERLERLGRENLEGLIADAARLGIDARIERTGEMFAVLAPYQDAWIEEEAALLRRFGHEVEVFPDAAAMRAEVASPTYRGGVWDRDGAVVLDPGRLALGLRDAAVRLGVRVHERTPVIGLAPSGRDAIELRTAQGGVHARRVLLASGAHQPLLGAIRRRVLPVYDYVLVTEPLSAERRAAIGWSRRQGMADGANRFHYYRLTADDRILWGGYDAVYRYGGPVGPEHDEHEPTFATLAQHFFTAFPQLEGVRFTHRWGGAIDTCSRFSVFFGTAHGGRVAYAAGYTGLGVGATRFAARTALDLLDGRDTERTRLRMVRRRAVPFPPEPLRSAVVRLTQHELARADEREGRRGVWLRLLDRLGLGFDS
jgi:glycine/D-amino acid oxidase-like deaminating enzyme